MAVDAAASNVTYTPAEPDEEKDGDVKDADLPSAAEGEEPAGQILPGGDADADGCVEVSVSPVEKLEHLSEFTFPAWRKRPPFKCCRLDIDLDRSAIVVVGDAEQGTAHERWSKLIEKECKKLLVEDLGKMSGHEGELLKSAFSQEGFEKLQKHEAEEKIKVIFRSDGHVLLVGTKVKLDKKAVPIRTLLAHFHWRLSGQYQV
eukprot:TRINITY_DN74592_c0_g1_i1.p1 TRINITY_DN74592_c0_g1~~TRINITY_DN74592_c0_g1_i1.p1  ORF type:complete len:203 (-),score=40.66 TRINITY_DN74592_c0_g1_i1:135-743(-)